MKTRIITAVIALGIFVPSVVVGGTIFWTIVSSLALMGVYEFFSMRKQNFFSVEGTLTSIATLSLIVGRFQFVAPDQLKFFYVFFLCVLLLMSCIVFNPNTTIIDVGLDILASIYVGAGFSGLLLVREIGASMVFFILIVIWSTDSFAYFVGKAFGKHKIAPDISPNKTIEGSIGGIVGAIFVALIYTSFFNVMKLSPLAVVCSVLILSIFGQLGDLVESAYKRQFGVKDSGNLFPGHGGVLDRFDSAFFAVFAFQIMLSTFITV